VWPLFVWSHCSLWENASVPVCSASLVLLLLLRTNVPRIHEPSRCAILRAETAGAADICCCIFNFVSLVDILHAASERTPGISSFVVFLLQLSLLFVLFIVFHSLRIYFLLFATELLLEIEASRRCPHLTCGSPKALARIAGLTGRAWLRARTTTARCAGRRGRRRWTLGRRGRARGHGRWGRRRTRGRECRWRGTARRKRGCCQPAPPVLGLRLPGTSPESDKGLMTVGGE